MGSWMSQLLDKNMPKKKCKLLILGLDGAGKTTILYSMKMGQVTTTVPTIGFNVEEVHYKQYSFMVWDIGGQDKLRKLWEYNYQGTKGLIFVLDSSDQQRLDLSSRELKRVLQHDEMSQAVLLVLANKRDLSCISVENICCKLELRELKRNWAIFPVTAIEQKQSGLEKAMDWLLENINHTLHPVKYIH